MTNHEHDLLHVKNFSSPDEIREFPYGRVEIINVGGRIIGRAYFEPGWRWQNSLQPIMKTHSCQAAHFQYHLSGVLHVVMDDGTEIDCRAGDVSLLPSGHDAWVVGDETVVVIDFHGMINYANVKLAKAMKQIKVAEEKLEAITNNLPLVVHQISATAAGAHQLTFVSNQAYRILGMSAVKLLENFQNFLEIVHDDDLQRIQTDIRCAIAKKEALSHEFRILSEDGIILWIHGEFSPFQQSDGETVWNGYWQNIDKQKAHEEILYAMAHTDTLTGIANRRHFDHRLEEEWRRAQRDAYPLSLLILDIDYFKQFNDHFGHQEGDFCLQKVAQALATISQRAGDLVARIGGEEFAVLLPKADEGAARKIAEKIRAGIENLKIPHPKSTVSPCVTVSVGVCTVIPSAASDFSALFKAADGLLYIAKEHGRNRWESA